MHLLTPSRFTSAAIADGSSAGRMAYHMLLLVVFTCVWPIDGRLRIFQESELNESPSRSVILHVAQRHCAKEMTMYCSDVAEASLYECLYDSREDVCQGCGAFLEEQTVGACNVAAASLCASDSGVDEITACLQRHLGDVGTTCATNLQHDSENRSLALVMREKYFERMSIVITICTFYLVLATVAWIWAIRMSSGLRGDQDKYVTRQLDTLVGAGIGSVGDTGDVKDSTHDLPPSLIELLNVSYRCNRRTCFSEVTGQFAAGSVTAVVGTGADELVRLLGGRLAAGEVRGQLTLNGTSATAAQLSQMMGKQGYADGGEATESLPGDLTVWQTILHCALLRLPESSGRHSILDRAWEVMQEVGLRDALHHLVRASSSACGPTDTTSAPTVKVLSTLQGKRLLIGLELLRAPSILFCPEIMDGLSHADCAQLLVLLRAISARRGVTVILSLSSPRQWQVLDGDMGALILLGAEGRMICSGSPAEVVSLVNAGIGERVQTISTALNCVLPGFESSVDAPQAGADEEQAALLTTGAGSSEEGVEMSSLVRQDGADVGRRQEKVRQRSLESRGAAMDHVLRPSGAQRSNTATDLVSRTVEQIVQPGRGERSGGRSPTKSVGGWQYERRGHTVPPLTQVWVVFSYHSQRHHSSWKASLQQACALTAVPLLVFAIPASTRAVFSDPDSAARSVFTAVMAVLLLATLHAANRAPQVANTDATCAGVRVSPWAWMLAGALRDVPAALILACSAIAALYVVDPHNPDETTVAFAVVCLVVGISAWLSCCQFVLQLAQQRTRGAVVLVLVLVLSVWMTGIWVPFTTIPVLVQYASVAFIPALLVRALVANDLHCCYLTLTCNALAQAGPSARGCPTGLHFSGDGSDLGNLGRAYLQDRGLESDRAGFLLFVLFVSSVVWRVGVVFLLKQSERKKSKLVHMQDHR